MASGQAQHPLVSQDKVSITICFGICLNMGCMVIHTCTVEPLNNGHIVTDRFVHYREPVLIQKQKCMQVGALESVLYSECPSPEVPLYLTVATLPYSVCFKFLT